MKKYMKKGVALLMLLCLLVPFAPTLVQLFATEAEAAADNILVYDDFQKGTSADYADAAGLYTATLTDGHLVLEKTQETYLANAQFADNTAYLFPNYPTIGNVAKMTISFEFTLVSVDVPACSLFVAYGATANTSASTNTTLQGANYNYGMGGLRLDGAAEFAGSVVAGARKRKFRTHYVSEGVKTNTEYLLAGSHTMTIQIEAGKASRVYIDGTRYLDGGTELWNQTQNYEQYQASNAGKLGIDLWKMGTKISIDNFLAYEGHGTLATTPTSTIGNNVKPNKVLLYDDFSDPYAYDYADASVTWQSGNGSRIENGKLILDSISGSGYGYSKNYNDYYPFPYEIPDGTESYTVEVQFSVRYLTNVQTDDRDWMYYRFCDAMLVYGAQNYDKTATNTNSKVFFNGVRVGTDASAGSYDYQQADNEFLGTLTINSGGSYNWARGYRELCTEGSEGDETVGSGLEANRPYTLVVQVTKQGSIAFIKEIPHSYTISSPTSYGWDGTSGQDPVTTGKTGAGNDISGFLGWVSAYKIETSFDSVTVYEGIREPNTVMETNYIYDDFVDTVNFPHPTVTNASATNGSVNFTRTYGGVTMYKLPHELPHNTVSFVAEVKFYLDRIPTEANANGNLDIFLAFGHSDSDPYYWTAGIRMSKTSMNDYVAINQVSNNNRKGRVYRGMKNSAGNTLGWGSLSAGTVYTMRVEVTPLKIRTTFINTAGVEYTASVQTQQWQWDADAAKFATHSLRLETANPSTATTTTQNVYFNNMRGGNLGLYSEAHFAASAKPLSSNATLSFSCIRVEYKQTKEIPADGTTLYYEDFEDPSVAKTYDHEDDGYKASVENGALKLTTKSACGRQAYMLPVTLSNVSAFTAKIVFSVDGIPPAGGSGGGGGAGMDLMLLYGSPGVNNKYGWLAGYRMNTATEWTAILQGEARRAYRSMPGTTNIFGYSLDTEKEYIPPISGEKYTMVIQVKNGRSIAYVEGYAAHTMSENIYSVGSIRDGNNMLFNAARYSTGSTDTSGNPTSYQMDGFANQLDGQLGLFNGFSGGTMRIDSISVTAGLAATADTKQKADGTVLYENDFNNANIDNYQQAGFTTALVDGALSITKGTGAALDLFLLPDSWVSGAKSMTVSFDFYGLDLDNSNASVMLGYNATDNQNFRFAGWRQGNIDSDNVDELFAFEQYGYVKTEDILEDGITGVGVVGRTARMGGRYYRTWLKEQGATATSSGIGSGDSLSRCQTYADLSDAWHKMTIVITADKATMFIDGQRLLWQTNQDGYVAYTDNAWRREYWSDDADSQNYTANPPKALTGGALGLFLFADNTSVKVDNVLCVAGVQDFANGNLTFEESYAGQGTVGAIDGVREDLYDRSGKLTTSQIYGSTAATATTEVLWDMSYLYFYTKVSDTTVANTDCVTYYINEDGTLSYASGDGAYMLTVYRSKAFTVGNTAATQGLQVFVSSDSTGYTIEARVPLLTKGAQTLSAGSDVGFNYVVKDADGWTSWTPGYGNFTYASDSLNRLSFVFTAAPTGDSTVIWPYFVFGGVALAGALGAVWVLLLRRGLK